MNDELAKFSRFRIWNFSFGIWILIFSLFGVACSNKSICLEPQNVALKGGFYYSISDTSISLKDSFLTNANVLVGFDTVLQSNIKNSPKFSTLLSTNSDSTTLYFQADSTNVLDENVDTIQVYHNNNLHFISVACGYQFYFNINQIKFTKHLIDTIYINNKSVNNNVNIEHLKIVLQK